MPDRALGAAPNHRVGRPAGRTLGPLAAKAVGANVQRCGLQYFPSHDNASTELWSWMVKVGGGIELATDRLVVIASEGIRDRLALRGESKKRDWS